MIGDFFGGSGGLDTQSLSDPVAQADPVEYITSRYLRGIERMILADPTQYLWAYPRWGKELGERLENHYQILAFEHLGAGAQHVDRVRCLDADR